MMTPDQLAELIQAIQSNSETPLWLAAILGGNVLTLVGVGVAIGRLVQKVSDIQAWQKHIAAEGDANTVEIGGLATEQARLTERVEALRGRA